MTSICMLHEQWMEDPEYRAEYEELGPEFELARATENEKKVYYEHLREAQEGD